MASQALTDENVVELLEVFMASPPLMRVRCGKCRCIAVNQLDPQVYRRDDGTIGSAPGLYPTPARGQGMGVERGDPHVLHRNPERPTVIVRQWGDNGQRYTFACPRRNCTWKQPFTRDRLVQAYVRAARAGVTDLVPGENI